MIGTDLEFTDWPDELQALIEAGVAWPDEAGLDINLGDEVQTSLEWAWVSARVAFMPSDEAEILAGLTEAGWRIVTSPEPEARAQLAKWLQQES